jgi:formylglycine-generating enzyme required for sulfatase activity
VSNLQYREFYKEVAANLSQSEKEKIACDTLGWRQELTYNEPMVEYYYQHPAFNNYPAVNISYEGADAYCKWLQLKIASNNPDFEIEVKLPDKIEWIYAAQGGRSQAMFPWGNYYLRNKKGEFMCNFRKVGDGAIYRNRITGKPEVAESTVVSTGGLNDRAYYTAEVKSFYPNDYGLYNMCGNAAEMISEKGIAMGGSWNDYGGDVHIQAQTAYRNSTPTVGFRPVIVVKQKER